MLASCSEDASVPGRSLIRSSERVAGTIELAQFGLPTPVKVPSSAKRGDAFTVTVYTTAGACDRADGAGVRISGTTAEIIPYDRRHKGACTDMAVPLEREVQLRFDEAGTGLIRIIGEPRFVGGSAVHDIRVQVTP
jgi:hypothetical protein